MVNIEKKPIGDAQKQFVDAVAALLMPWGMAPSQARVYGYLLLHDGPISLERIAAQLQLSKVGAWKAARSLEEFGHVRRYGEPGSKRALYGPTDQFETPLVRQAALLGELGSLLRAGAQEVDSAGARTRLRAMSRFYLAMRAAVTQTIAAQRPAAPIKRTATAAAATSARRTGTTKKPRSGAKR